MPPLVPNTDIVFSPAVKRRQEQFGSRGIIERWEQRGGFREDLPVLEDWELILRYTHHEDPLYVDCVLADYILEEGLTHLTSRLDLGAHYHRVRRLYGK